MMRRLRRSVAGLWHGRATRDHDLANGLDGAGSLNIGRNPVLDQIIARDTADRSLQLLGQIASRAQSRNKPIDDLSAVEFRVFSQWGEDGIIDWLVSHVVIASKRFIEFGVENFREANCRFLMQNHNWSGLVFDGTQKYISWLKSEAFYWMHALTANVAFVTAENIDKLIIQADFSGEVGILSIDIDGNDYWVWQAIKSVNPAIVICEVNPIFGDREPITIPYDPMFARLDAHFSGLYFGASIGALKHLAEQRGYSFIGTNASGVNAFFVRTDLAGPVLDLVKNHRAFPSSHRDSRDQAGNLSFISGVDRLSIIGEMPVVDVVTGKTFKLRDIRAPYSEEWLAVMR